MRGARGSEGTKRERGEREGVRGARENKGTITENISLWEGVWSNRYKKATIT